MDYCHNNARVRKHVQAAMSISLDLSLFWCIAICSGGCGTNQNCTAPETCTCVEGWTGQDCLTGICCVSIEIIEATTILMGDYDILHSILHGLNFLNICNIFITLISNIIV